MSEEPIIPICLVSVAKSHGGTVKSSPDTALGTKLWRSPMELVRSDSRLPGSHRTEDLARPYTWNEAEGEEEQKKALISTAIGVSGDNRYHNYQCGAESIRLTGR